MSHGRPGAGSREGTHERALKDGKGPYFVPWPSHASWTRPFLAISRRAQGKPREVGAIIKVTSRVEKVRLREGTELSRRHAAGKAGCRAGPQLPRHALSPRYGAPQHGSQHWGRQGSVRASDSAPR